MPKKMVWKKGKPDKPGWWWILPSKKFCMLSGSQPRPRIIEVKEQGDVVPGKPELYMQFRDGRLEAWLFDGKVAGPIPQPTS